MFRTGKIKLNPQINLPFNFVIQKYFFHDNPTWNINYSEHLLMVKNIKPKRVRIGIEFFLIGIELELINLRWNWN
jgi:hypothetical protein